MRVGAAFALMAGLATAWLGLAGAEAQDLQSQVAVDRVLRALTDAMPPGAESYVGLIVPSDEYFLRGGGRQIQVSTRFLQESSPDGIAAAAALELIGEPVWVAVALYRGGFDGPGGLAELYDRVVQIVNTEAQGRATLETMRVELNRMIEGSAVSTTLPGIGLRTQAEITAASQQYQQAVAAYNAYRAEMPRMYAMRAVPPDYIQSVAEVTWVLRGQQPIETSPWGERIRAALDRYELDKKPQ
jgi:hypothetical protein